MKFPIWYWLTLKVTWHNFQFKHVFIKIFWSYFTKIDGELITWLFKICPFVYTLFRQSCNWSFWIFTPGIIFFYYIIYMENWTRSSYFREKPTRKSCINFLCHFGNHPNNYVSTCLFISENIHKYKAVPYNYADLRFDEGFLKWETEQGQNFWPSLKISTKLPLPFLLMSFFYISI